MRLLPATVPDWCQHSDTHLHAAEQFASANPGLRLEIPPVGGVATFYLHYFPAFRLQNNPSSIEGIKLSCSRSMYNGLQGNCHPFIQLSLQPSSAAAKQHIHHGPFTQTKLDSKQLLCQPGHFTPGFLDQPPAIWCFQGAFFNM